MSSPSLTIHLFGPIQVLLGSDPLPRVPTRSVEWLLALLVLRQGRSVDRSWLAGTLWPDSAEEQARRNLRNDLMHLRKALGSEGERIQSPTRDTLTLDLEGAEADVVRFDRAIQAGEEEALREAVEIYTGPLLEGCYEAWVTLERENREQAFLTALEALADRAQQRGDHAGAIRYLRRAEALEPLRESVARRLMASLEALGDPAAAIEVYREYRLRLRREMNVEPDAETTDLFRQIRDRARQPPKRKDGGGRRKVAYFSFLPHPSTALPLPISPLVGREEDTKAVAGHLSASRLVTLVGIGGIGKTRLAIQVAADIAASFPASATSYSGGPVFVTLASLSDSALLPSFVASALGLREETSPESESHLLALSGWFSTREVLLVLDNCEHLIEAVAELCQNLLERCPRLRILATSRQRLGLTGEIVWRVPSLPAPDPDSLPEDDVRLQEEVARSPAVQLFVERASRVQPGFQMAGRQRAMAVARICQRLDGIPLAIELAAVRAGLLTLDQIAARLDDRFRLLTGGDRGVLTRHQTLRALIDWSYDLLSEPERALLRRLSVFTDSWTLEAAEHMGVQVFGCSGVQEERADQRTEHPNARTPEYLNTDDALDLLSSLMDKSLVVAQDQEGALRYRMLETIREYALEKLRASGEEEAARNQHLAYFLKLAQEIGPALCGSDLESVLGRLEAEVGNFRAALAWAQIEAAPPEAHVQLTATLWPFWQYHRLAEVREHLRTARIRSEGAETPERAQVLLGEARLTYLLHELDEAFARGQESLTLFRRLGDRRGIAEALLYMGMIARERVYDLQKQELENAIALLTEGLEEAQRCGWTRGSAIALLQLGLAMVETDAERARSLLEESLSLAEASGDPLLTAQALQRLGHLELMQGRFDRIGDRFERALAIHRRFKDWHEVALTLRWMGGQARKQGNLAQSVAYYQEAAVISREQGNPVYLAASLQECGCVLYERGEYAQAKAAFTEALALYRQPGGEYGIGFGCNLLGSALFHLGEYGRARELHREALALYHASSNIEGITWSLERLAVVEAAHRDVQKGARLLGAASAGREGLGKPMDRWDQEDWDQAVAAVRMALGEAAFTAAFESGRALSREQAAEQAMAGTEPPLNVSSV